MVKLGKVNRSKLEKKYVLIIGGIAICGAIVTGIIINIDDKSEIHSSTDSMIEPVIDENINDDCLFVNVDGLKIRTNSSTNSLKIDTLVKGTKVYLNDKYICYNDGDYEWCYVTYIDDVTGEEIEGWVAAIDYTQSVPSYYLIGKKQIEEKKQLDASINAESAIVVDIESGQIIYEKNIYQKMNPASITKILSNYVVYKNLDNVCRISDSLISYEKEDINVDGHSSEGYGIGNSQLKVSSIARVGGKIPYKDAIRISLLLSENSTTLALENCLEKHANGSHGHNALIETNNFDFIEQMNLEARNMGCSNYNFSNSYGYESESHYVTANDMAKIVSYIAHNCPDIIEIMGESEYTIDYTEQPITIKHQSKLLDVESIYYDPEVIACQTGASDAAMTSIYNKNGRRYAVITFDGKVKDSKYEDSKLLSNYIDNLLSKKENGIDDLIAEVSVTNDKVNVLIK